METPTDVNNFWLPIVLNKHSYLDSKRNIIVFEENTTVFNYLQHRYEFNLYVGKLAVCYSHIPGEHICSNTFKHSSTSTINVHSITNSVDELIDNLSYKGKLKGLYLFSWGTESLGYYAIY